MQQTNRIADIYRPVEERVKDNNEVERKLTSIEVINQAGRCSAMVRVAPSVTSSPNSMRPLLPGMRNALTISSARRRSSRSSRAAFARRSVNPPVPATCITTR